MLWVGSGGGPEKIKAGTGQLEQLEPEPGLPTFATASLAERSEREGNLLAIAVTNSGL